MTNHPKEEMLDKVPLIVEMACDQMQSDYRLVGRIPQFSIKLPKEVKRSIRRTSKETGMTRGSAKVIFATNVEIQMAYHLRAPAEINVECKRGTLYFTFS